MHIELGSKMGCFFFLVLLAVVETNEPHISINYPTKSMPHPNLDKPKLIGLFVADLSDRYLHGRHGTPPTYDVQVLIKNTYDVQVSKGK